MSLATHGGQLQKKSFVKGVQDEDKRLVITLAGMVRADENKSKTKIVPITRCYENWTAWLPATGFLGIHLSCSDSSPKICGHFNLCSSCVR
eukprot:4580598-Amphidinium_carterae.1